MKLYIKTVLFCIFTLAINAIAENGHWIVTSKSLALLIANINNQPLSEPLFNSGIGIHHKSIKPSQRLKLASADKVFWNGNCLEPELSKLIKEQQSITANCNQALLHWWLHPQSIVYVANHLVVELSKLQPQQAQLYQHNLERLIIDLNKIVSEAQQKWQPMQLMFFHDAFPELTQLLALPDALVLQAQESGLNSVGEQYQRQKQLRQSVDCLLIEAQYRHTKISQWAAKLVPKVVQFNPLEQPINLAEADLFIQFYRALHQQLASCLA